MYGWLHYQISTEMKGKEGLFSRINPNLFQALGHLLKPNPLLINWLLPKDRSCLIYWVIARRAKRAHTREEMAGLFWIELVLPIPFLQSGQLGIESCFYVSDSLHHYYSSKEEYVLLVPQFIPVFFETVVGGIYSFMPVSNELIPCGE